MAKSLSGMKQIIRKSLDESDLEINKSMARRSRTRNSIKHANEAVEGGKNRYKLRPRKGKKTNLADTV